MILIEKMKSMKIYKTPTFLPTIKESKKKKSAIFLLTPNYESSKRLMNFDLFINSKRFESYYLQKDVSYYIDSKNIKKVDDENVNESYINEMSKSERDKLKSSEFGLPKDRKYPLDTESRVRSAVKFFNYCDKSEEEELAKNIIKAIKKFNINDIVPSDKNRFSKYYTNESYIDYLSESFIKEIPDSSINTNDKIILFGENAKYDSQLKRILYSDRIKQRKDLLLLLDEVKQSNDFINFVYPELKRYQQKNLFIDLYYYNKLFLENNSWVANKGLNLYIDFLDRLINKFDYNKYGYERKTIFIPIEDWTKDGNVWNFRKSLNPISIIYQLLYTNKINELKKVFNDYDILFIGKNKYFKINFSKLDLEDAKNIHIKFKLFVNKIYNDEEFDLEDIDSSAENDSSDVIAAKIVDKIEKSKGIDLTQKVALANKNKQNIISNGKIIPQNATIAVKKSSKPSSKNNNIISKDNINKISKNTLNQDNKFKSNIDSELDNVADIIDSVSNDSSSEDEALDKMNDYDDIKDILIDLDNNDTYDNTNEIEISEERKKRIEELKSNVPNIKINNKTVQEILDDKNETIPTTDLKVSGPNNEEWKDLKYINFNKNYNIEKDIINIFKHFENTSYPVVIRNIEVTDNSTSEDRLDLYSVDMEDYNGKRFNIKLDIPIMEDNRFLLRGYSKSISNQFFNMPIIKNIFSFSF